MNGFVDMDAVTRNSEEVWAADEAVRAEFQSKDVYLAFRRAEASGRTATVGQGRATAFISPTVQTSAPGEPDTEWASDASLRAEFCGDKSAYIALRRAEMDGRVRTLAPRAEALQTALAAPPHAQMAAPPLGGNSLAERQAQTRQENVGRQFAGLPELPVPQQ